MGGTRGSEAAGDHSRDGPPYASSAACRRLSAFQCTALLALCGTGGTLIVLQPGLAASLMVAGAAAVFLTLSLWRITLVVLSATPSEGAVLTGRDLPAYTVLVALHDEAEIMDQLVSRLARLDYPADRLQGLLVLEAHDTATLAAAARAACS